MRKHIIDLVGLFILIYPVVLYYEGDVFNLKFLFDMLLIFVARVLFGIAESIKDK